MQPKLRNENNSFANAAWRWSTILGVLVLLGTGIATSAQTYKVLANIGSDQSNSLVQGLDGNLYGGTSNGTGAHGRGGSIFKITPGGKLTTIYTFCSQPNCADGSNPTGALVLSTDGNFYGETREGGANSNIACNGETSATCGTVFKITPSGQLTTIYNFCTQTNCIDGSLPNGGLIQGTDGNFYGVTNFGGTSVSCPNNGTQPLGCGTVFKVTPTGTLTSLYSFCTGTTCPDGAFPQSSLVQGHDGNFYGTTLDGGTGTGGPQCNFLECGTIFKLTPRGVLTSLYSFCLQTGCPDGSHPGAGLLLANNGLFYGVTVNGGANDDGTVFSFKTAGNSLATLYSFCAQTNCPDGESPEIALTQASDGNLYGTTFSGGANSSGTIFKITSAGALTTLYSFCAQTNCNDGSLPSAALFQATNGTLYGSTQSGGPTSFGVTYSLAAGLHRFVETVPTSGKVGSKITILGNNFAGATAVSFHGMAAIFTVVSATEITTTVPTGATTGKISVTTPTGTLSTVGPFRVP